MLSSVAEAKDRTSSISYEYELGAVSDYRFRGVSYSDERPAVQGGASASLKGGAYGSIWASSIEEYGGGADGKGATVELDYTVGRAFKTGRYDIDLGASLYTFPRGENVDYLEFPVSVSRAVAQWTWTLGAAYTPKQGALPDEDNSYAFGRAVWARADGLVSVSGTAGYEHGAFAPHGKWDWSATVSRAVGPVEAALSFVAVEKGFGGDTLLASLKATF
jgi:uncharacterized protein (TIGR02001 family)